MPLPVPVDEDHLWQLGLWQRIESSVVYLQRRRQFLLRQKRWNVWYRRLEPFHNTVLQLRELAMVLTVPQIRLRLTTKDGYSNTTSTATASPLGIFG